MSETDDEDISLKREEIEDSGADVAITDIFKKPTTKLVLETSDGDIERATILGESQDNMDEISVKGDFEVKELDSDEAMFIEITFLDDSETYYIELDEDTIWNIYQHFGTIQQDELINKRSILDHVNRNSIVLNRSQYKELFYDKPSLSDQSELDVSLSLNDYERPVQNYEEIVHTAALNKNTPFSVIVDQVTNKDDLSTVVVRHGELIYTFKYRCETSELQNCNPTFKRLVNEIGNGEPKAVEGSTLQIREKETLSKEQPIYGELTSNYVLTRPLTNNKSVFSKMSSILSKGKLMYRGDSDYN